MKLTVKLKNSASCSVTGTKMKVSQMPARVRNVNLKKKKTALGAVFMKRLNLFLVIIG